MAGNLVNRIQNLVSRINWTTARRTVISAGLVTYLFFIGFYCSPHGKFRDYMLRPVFFAIEYCGLWQDWQMFSPDPDTRNLYLTAVIWFDDKTSVEYKFPRMEQMSLTEKFVRERWRKFGQDNLSNTDLKFMWPPFCRYLARLHDSPKRHPVSVELCKHISFHQTFNDYIDGKPYTPKWENTYFFSYQVPRRELE
jgi:hypothetical protein